MTLTQLFKTFIQSKKTGGLLLVFATIVSLGLANSPWQTSYIDFWHIDLKGNTLIHWINDGLMTLFFLYIGLQLKRELYEGKLSTLKSAALPFFGALGGMIIPAGFFIGLNYGTATQAGAGIPMATDIAFAIGILSLLGKRVPTSLKIFLTALAIIDDLGAILIIAIFYTTSFSFENLGISLGIFGFLLLLNQLKIRHLFPYLIGGIVMWYFMMNSGIHPTLTGVLLAFAITFGDGEENSSSTILQDYLSKPVAFIILPLFAIANTCIAFGDSWLSGLIDVNSLGIIGGLVIGKPLGILLFSWISVRLGFCALPSELKWSHILGVGLLAGIGFTMSIFITLLAFNHIETINASKIAILFASVAAGLLGYLWLKKTLK
jgi:NhaA family Na+:H+ antiporter